MVDIRPSRSDSLVQIKSDEKKALIPQAGNLFDELHQILTSTDAIDFDDEEEAEAMVDAQQPALNFK